MKISNAAAISRRGIGMTEQLIEAFLSPRQTSVVTCPHCNQVKTFTLSDLPPRFPNPFQYDCPCGATLRIALDYRKSYRKSVDLAGSFTLPSDAKKIPRFFDTLDVSPTGMQIVTDDVKTLWQGQTIDATVILHDKQRTKLDLTCIVRRITRSKNRLTLGLAFKNLTPHQQQALGSHLMT
jgi:hypothetical protein